MDDLPRLSLDALCAQLFLKDQALCVVVEGQTENDVIRRWCSNDNLDSYFVGDLDIGEHGEDGSGNKERVISVLRDNCIKDYVDEAIIGVVDRDFDYVLNRRIKTRGVYYTEFSCFTSSALRREVLEEIFAGAFGKTLSVEFLVEFEQFNLRMFALKAWVAKNKNGVRLPKIEGRVRKVVEGGFDWTSYLAAAQSSVGKICREELLDRLASRWVRSGDIRLFLHFHTALEYLWRLGRKEGILGSDVKQDEVYRHIRTYLKQDFSVSALASLIINKMAERMSSQA